MIYVVSDVHGHRAELQDALFGAGLVDAAGQWSGRDTRLWFLGDYVDRGPDGIGVLDDVRRLTAQAAVAGGEVGALLGNHEAQMTAAHLFGADPVPGWDQPDGFRGGWLRFGGRDEDLRRLTAEHVAWIAERPAIAVVGDFLLMHSDTTSYLRFGDDVATVNAAVRTALAGRDMAAWLEFCGRMSDRGSFRDCETARPGDAVDTMLTTFGGSTLVHGHSTLPKRFGVPAAEVRDPLR